MKEGTLYNWSQWLPPPPSVWVASDDPDVGWGYHSINGQQDFGGWLERDKRLHINVRKLMFPLFYFQSNKVPQGMAVCYEMDNTVAVHCISRHGT